MKYKKIIAGLVAMLCLIAAVGFVRQDDDPIQKIIAQLNKWTSERPVEKVYLHLDKPYYAVGDDIWFKAYITIGSVHQLSALSNILNVELIDSRDSVKQSIKLPVVNGLTYGDFALADTLQEGNYRIRAYTNYMRNAGEDYFFDKAIVIGNAINNSVFTKTSYQYATTPTNQQGISAQITYTDLSGAPYAGKEVSYDVQLDTKSVKRGKGLTDDKGNITVNFTNTLTAQMRSGKIVTNIKLGDKRIITKTIPVKATSAKVSVQFFPESGNLVSGVRSKVAFKALGADGLGVDVSGVVKDNEDKEVGKFKTQHAGMGVFTLFAEEGKTYKASITYPDGSVGSIDLPKAMDKGYVLNINNSLPDNLIVKIFPGRALLADSSSNSINLVAHAGGVVCYAAKSKVTNTSFTAVIPKSKFPSGIVQFTLFSGTGEPLNERIVFIQNDDQLKMNVASEKQSYGTRQKVKINLDAKDKDDKPVVGSFSAAVIDEGKVPVDETAETTIMSSILLSSDIRGYIERPNYYFTNISEQTRADLDALMLTQGYRRFEWKQLMNDVFTPFVFKPEKTLSVSGTVKTTGGKAVAKGKVSLFSAGHGLFYLDTVTDDKGHFTFDRLTFTDSIKFVVQARTGKGGKYVDIELDNVAPQIVGKNQNAPDVQLSISDGFSTYLMSSKNKFNEEVKYGIGNHTTMLKEVTVVEKKKNVFENSSNLNGPGNADQTVTYEKLNSCPTLTLCLQGLLTGVMFHDGSAYSTRSMQTPMQIIVDGMYMDADFLDQIQPTDVATVEVLRSAGNTAIYGSRGGGGVLVITMKRGGEESTYQHYSPGVLAYKPKGYYKSREFYSPDYDSPKTNTQASDMRSTIFWKPGIITDTKGHASFEYFNADGKGTYRVVIEGIDSDGNLGRQVYRYKVD